MLQVRRRQSLRLYAAVAPTALFSAMEHQRRDQAGKGGSVGNGARLSPHAVGSKSSNCSFLSCSDEQPFV